MVIKTQIVYCSRNQCHSMYIGVNSYYEPQYMFYTGVITGVT